MGTSLDTLTIKGFKSIQELSAFKLNSLNVIVGANGAGKSNLIAFFKMLRALIDGNLNRFVRDSGGASDLLFGGRKMTSEMTFETRFGDRGYRFTLMPTLADSCVIEDEACFLREPMGLGLWDLLSIGGNSESDSRLAAEAHGNHPDMSYAKPVFDAISSWQVYHFHDTSQSAGMRNYEIVQDNSVLRADATNIGSFLLKLRNQFPSSYQAILAAVRLVIPFFDDFILVPRLMGASEKVNLSWQQKGSDYPMQPYHLSDGSIRFICLATALLQPNPPSTIIIDEPELGLHPAAIAILAELIQQASLRTQVIVATQSPALIDQFAIDDIVVVNRKGGASTFERLNEADYAQWLEEYSVGELWTKNVIAGGPRYE
ncbi:cobalt transporter ATP-binding subunit [Aeromonas rivipollensis]|uniref:AAA family ATPase n=1 Tax=Aeromonas TaxID=642 RepID=UPI0021F4E303|nr:AAA family ATPase [Aeromonas hydrophila]MCV9382205.1 AAA family ATPase [Aeromonas hydrophila]